MSVPLYFETPRRWRPKWWTGPVVLLITPALVILAAFDAGATALVASVVLPWAVLVLSLWGLRDIWQMGLERAARRGGPPPLSDDADWRSGGEERSGWTRALRVDPIWFVLVMTAVQFFALGLIAVRVFLSPAAALAEKAVLALLVAAVPVVIWRVYRRFIVFSAGSTRVAYDRFPTPTTGPLTLRFSVDEGASPFFAARYRLACVREHLPRQWDAPGFIAAQELYAEEADLPQDQAPAPGGGVELTFAPPTDLPATNLRARCRTYWELRVVAHTQSGAYDETFLIPVYEA